MGSGRRGDERDGPDVAVPAGDAIRDGEVGGTGNPGSHAGWGGKAVLSADAVGRDDGICAGHGVAGFYAFDGGCPDSAGVGGRAVLGAGVAGFTSLGRGAGADRGRPSGRGHGGGRDGSRNAAPGGFGSGWMAEPGSRVGGAWVDLPRARDGAGRSVGGRPGIGFGHGAFDGAAGARGWRGRYPWMAGERPVFPCRHCRCHCRAGGVQRG